MSGKIINDGKQYKARWFMENSTTAAKRKKRQHYGWIRALRSDSQT